LDHEKDRLNWYVRDGYQTKGPLRWRDVEFQFRNGEIPPDGMIMNNIDNRWVSITNHFSEGEYEKDDENDEIHGLLPNKTDAIFLLGLLAFFIGFGLYFVNNFLSYAVLLISLGLEFGGVYLSHKKDPRSILKNIGNMFALMWVVFQTIITLPFIFLTLF